MDFKWARAAVLLHMCQIDNVILTTCEVCRVFNNMTHWLTALTLQLSQQDVMFSIHPSNNEYSITKEHYTHTTLQRCLIRQLPHTIDLSLSHLRKERYLNEIDIAGRQVHATSVYANSNHDTYCSCQTRWQTVNVLFVLS